MGVARIDLMQTRSPRRMAAHLAQETEPQAERDAAAHLAGEPVPRAPGTPLRAWDGMSPAAARALGAEPQATLTHPQVVALVDGRRPDGTDIPRPARARHHGGDDKDGQQRLKFVHLTLSPHISWSLGYANARTPAGAAIIASVFDRAASRTLADVEAHAAVARRQVNGQRVEESGRFAAWSATHHATRPQKDGWSAPDLHRQYVIPNAVLLPSGEVRALDARKLVELQKEHAVGRWFSHHLAEEGRAAGLRVETRHGAAVLADVPDHVVEHFSRRSREAEIHAKAWTAARGEDWTTITERQRRARLEVGMRATAGSMRDGMADRPAWRRQCESLGWPSVDLAGQQRVTAAPPRTPRPGLDGLLARARALRSAAVQTRQHVQRLRQGAAMTATFGPSIAVAVARKHAVAAMEHPRSRAALLTSARLLRTAAQRFARRYQVRAAVRLGASLRASVDRSVTFRVARAVARQFAPSVLRRRAELLASTARVTLQAARAFRDVFRAGFHQIRTARGLQPPQQPTVEARMAQRVRAETLAHRAQSRSPEPARAAGVAIGLRRDIELLAGHNRSRMPAANLMRQLRARAETVEQSARQVPPEVARASGEGVSERRDRLILEAVAKATAKPEPAPARQPPTPAVQAEGPARAAVKAPAPASVRPPVRVQISQTDAEAQLRDALRQAGIKPDGHQIQWDGQIHYLPTRENRGTEKSGGYIAHWDGRRPAAAIYNWKTSKSESGFVGTWKADGDTTPLSAAEVAALERDAATSAAAAQARRSAELTAGAREARAAVDASRPAPADHPYLAKKGLPVQGERMDAQGNLLIPLLDVRSGEVVNAQHISPTGSKWPVTGAQKIGTGAPIGEQRPESPLIVAEGYASAKRLHLSLGERVWFGLDAGNVGAVARALREQHPDKEIVFAADNDHHLPHRPDGPRVNVGITKAEHAAREVGNARVWAPPALDERLAAASKERPAGQAVGTDWDDFAQAKGGGTVKALWDLSRQDARTPAKAPAADLAPWQDMADKGKAAQAAKPVAADRNRSRGMRV